jgi:RNA polymerase sigma factor (sigma-70 family)
MADLNITLNLGGEKQNSLKMTAKRFHALCSDEELVEGCLLNDRIAQRLLYERFAPRMLSVAMRYSNDEDQALDVLNQAFLKVFSSFDKYVSQSNLSGWIARIVFNQAIDCIRKNIKYKNMIEFSGEHSENSIQNDAIKTMNASEILAYVQKLPNNTRTVFSLYVIDGYKHSEIADLLNITVGTSKWHLGEARRELKKMLANFHI